MEEKEKKTAASPEKTAASPEKKEPQKKPKSDNKKAAIEKLERELNETKDTLLRTAAEFDNFRKRTERDRISTIEYTKAQVIKQLLPIFDNVDRAAGFSHDSEEFIKGIELIIKQLTEISSGLGLTAFGEVGDTFDPALHEAVMHIDDDSLPENSVSQVLQKGYRLGDTVVRHAMVQVAN